MIPADRIAATNSCWPTILCIDDDPQITEAIRRRLSQFEVEVTCAYHGMHGFWLAMTVRPDLIITDLRMPQGSGEYVIECLRNNTDTRSIPVIVLTGRRESEIEQNMRRLGVHTVLTKPAPFDKLRAAIAELVPLRQRETRLPDDSLGGAELGSASR